MTGTGRTERDSMGEFEVPADAYYGATSMRAHENFPISAPAINAVSIQALAHQNWRRRK